MTGPDILLALCYGLFSMGAQALLFREYMVTFESLDLSIGLFFAAWLVWAAAGTRLYRKARQTTPQSPKARELLVVAYVPAICVAYGLVLLLQHLVGSGAAVSTTFWLILGSSLLITAPVGLLTGLLFPLLNHPLREPGTAPAGRIYALEAVGSAIGGFAVSALLHQGAGPPLVLLILTIAICLPATWSAFARPQPNSYVLPRTAAVTFLAFALALLAFRADRTLTRIVEQAAWKRAVPEGRLQGGFVTSQARYLYGSAYDGWVVLRDGRRHEETVADRPEAGRTAAIALCQSFTVEQVLVVGDGLSVCQSLLKSPRVQGVSWCTPDPAYAPAMLAHLPASLQISDPRFRCLTDDTRNVLAQSPQTYDIVIVNLSEAVNASSGRFLSAEFLELAKRSLRPMGLLVVGVETGDDLITEEPAYTSAWINSTLDAVFTQTLLVPTEERTFFVSAPSPYLEISPVTLEVRFSLLENANAIFPPESLSSVYRPDLTLKALDACDAVALPERMLVSSDHRPSHYLCHALQTADRSGWSLIEPIQSVLRGPLAVATASIALLVLVRLAYIVRTAPRGSHLYDTRARSVFRYDVLLIAGGSGMAGFGTFLVLVHAYQTHYGSLGFDMGLLSSLFMFGLAVGALCIRRMACWLPSQGLSHLYPAIFVLTILLAIHAAYLVGVSLCLDRVSSWPFFALLLSAGGLFCGGTLALEAKMLATCEVATESAAEGLRIADHLGAALGSILTALLLIPLVGFEAALYVLAALVLGNVVMAVALYYHVMYPGPRVIPHPLLTPTGYGLFAVATSVVIGSHILAYIERSQAQSASITVVQEWIEGRRVSDKTVTVGSPPRSIIYQEVREQSRLKGYILRSEDFVGTVYGYGGPMSIIMFADPNGTLLDYRLTRSRETPRYIRRIADWMASLKGKTLFGPDPVAGVNTISGATLSCDAILKLLRNSGREFTASVLAPEEAAQAIRLHWIERVNRPLVCWLAGLVLALGAIYCGRLWARLAVLVYTVSVTGFWLNRQYSTEHAIRLLAGDGLLDGSVGSLCLLVGVPLIALLLGNIYCGYLCPFGALQEMVGFLIPRRFKAGLSLSTITASRFVKYAILFAAVVVFFLSGSRRLLEADPLTAFFGWRTWSREFLTSSVFATAVVVLVAALLITRIWCRYLCPTGAFLSLFNLAGWLRRLLPAKKFGRCEFGLGGRDHLDCIHCDRCRYDSPLVPTRNEAVVKAPPNAESRLFLVLLLCLIVLTLVSALREPPTITPTEVPTVTIREPAR